MRLGILTAAALALTASAANASWTGCRVGVFAGMGAATSDVAFSGVSLVDFGTDGPQGGVVAGCDMQFDRIIVGGFVDYALQSREFEIIGFGLAKTEGQWSIGGRLGTTLTPTTAVFVTGGYTEAKSDDILELGDLKGWFVGGTFETEFAKNLYLSADYRYEMFDDRTILGVPDLTSETTAHVARIGISYKFNVSDPLAPLK